MAASKLTCAFTNTSKDSDGRSLCRCDTIPSAPSCDSGARGTSDVTKQQVKEEMKIDAECGMKTYVKYSVERDMRIVDARWFLDGGDEDESSLCGYWRKKKTWIDGLPIFDFRCDYSLKNKVLVNPSYEDQVVIPEQVCSGWTSEVVDLLSRMRDVVEECNGVLLYQSPGCETFVQDCFGKRKLTNPYVPYCRMTIDLQDLPIYDSIVQQLEKQIDGDLRMILDLYRHSCVETWYIMTALLFRHTTTYDWIKFKWNDTRMRLDADYNELLDDDPLTRRVVSLLQEYQEYVTSGGMVCMEPSWAYVLYQYLRSSSVRRGVGFSIGGNIVTPWEDYKGQQVAFSMKFNGGAEYWLPHPSLCCCGKDDNSMFRFMKHRLGWYDPLFDTVLDSAHRHWKCWSRVDDDTCDKDVSLYRPFAVHGDRHSVGWIKFWPEGCVARPGAWCTRSKAPPDASHYETLDCRSVEKYITRWSRDPTYAYLRDFSEFVEEVQIEAQMDMDPNAEVKEDLPVNVSLVRPRNESIADARRKIDAIPGTSDDNYSVAALAGRLHHFYNQKWSSGMQPVIIDIIQTLYGKHSQLNTLLMVHSQFKFDLCFRLMINVNKFNVGRLGMAFLPPGRKMADDMTEAQKIYFLTTLTYVEMDVAIGGECTLFVPFCTVYDHIDTYSPWFDMESIARGIGLGSVVLFPIVDLQVPEGGAPNVETTIMVSVVDPEMKVPVARHKLGGSDMITSAVPQGNTEIGEQISKVAGNIVGGLTRSVVKTGLGMVGLDRPLDYATMDRPVLGLVGGITHGDGIDYSERLSLSQARVMVDSRPDVFQDLMRKSSVALKYKPQWVNTVSTHPIVLPVHPRLNAGGKLGNSLVTYGSYLNLLSGLFKYWSGSLDFKIEFVCSHFATGRLAVSWLPTFGAQYDFSQILCDELLSNPSVIVDLTENRVVEFSVPYIAPAAFKLIPQVIRPESSDNGIWFYSDETCNGLLVIHVINDLSCPTNTVATLEVLIGVTAGRDFRLSVPVLPFRPYDTQIGDKIPPDLTPHIRAKGALTTSEMLKALTRHTTKIPEYETARYVSLMARVTNVGQSDDTRDGSRKTQKRVQAQMDIAQKTDESVDDVVIHGSRSDDFGALLRRKTLCGVYMEGAQAMETLQTLSSEALLVVPVTPNITNALDTDGDYFGYIHQSEHFTISSPGIREEVVLISPAQKRVVDPTIKLYDGSGVVMGNMLSMISSCFAFYSGSLRHTFVINNSVMTAGLVKAEYEPGYPTETTPHWFTSSGSLQTSYDERAWCSGFRGGLSMAINNRTQGAAINVETPVQARTRKLHYTHPLHDLAVGGVLRLNISRSNIGKVEMLKHVNRHNRIEHYIGAGDDFQLHVPAGASAAPVVPYPCQVGLNPAPRVAYKSKSLVAEHIDMNRLVPIVTYTLVGGASLGIGYYFLRRLTRPMQTGVVDIIKKQVETITPQLNCVLKETQEVLNNSNVAMKTFIETQGRVGDGVLHTLDKCGDALDKINSVDCYPYVTHAIAQVFEHMGVRNVSRKSFTSMARKISLFLYDCARIRGDMMDSAVLVIKFADTFGVEFPGFDIQSIFRVDDGEVVPNLGCEDVFGYIVGVCRQSGVLGGLSLLCLALCCQSYSVHYKTSASAFVKRGDVLERVTKAMEFVRKTLSDMGGISLTVISIARALPLIENALFKVISIVCPFLDINSSVDLSVFDETLQEARDWVQCINYRDNALYRDRLTRDQNAQVDMAAKHREGTELYSRMMRMNLGHNVLTTFSRVLQVSRELDSIAHKSNVLTGQRREPFCVCFCGVPGLGKTTLAMTIGKKLGALEGYKGTSDVYVRSSEDVYFSGYNRQPVVFYDDFPKTTSNEAHQVMAEFLNIKSNAPCQINMADLDSKGMQFTSPIIMMTTNNERFVPSNMLDRKAFLRRRDLLIEVIGEYVPGRKFDSHYRHLRFQFRDALTFTEVGGPKTYEEMNEIVESTYLEWCDREYQRLLLIVKKEEALDMFKGAVQMFVKTKEEQRLMEDARVAENVVEPQGEGDSDSDDTLPVYRATTLDPDAPSTSRQAMVYGNFVWRGGYFSPAEIDMMRVELVRVGSLARLAREDQRIATFEGYCKRHALDVLTALDRLEALNGERELVVPGVVDHVKTLVNNLLSLPTQELLKAVLLTAVAAIPAMLVCYAFKTFVSSSSNLRRATEGLVKTDTEDDEVDATTMEGDEDDRCTMVWNPKTGEYDVVRPERRVEPNVISDSSGLDERMLHKKAKRKAENTKRARKNVAFRKRNYCPQIDISWFNLDSVGQSYQRIVREYNTVCFKFHCDGVAKSAYGVGVQDKIVMMPAHYWESWERLGLKTILCYYRNTSTVVRLSECEVVQVTCDDEQYKLGENGVWDVLFVHIPSLPQSFRSISKYFVDSQDLCDMGEVIHGCVDYANRVVGDRRVIGCTFEHLLARVDNARVYKEHANIGLHDVYVYHATTAKGDCGSLAYVIPTDKHKHVTGRIFGMHVAGSRGTGSLPDLAYVVVIWRELVENAIKQFNRSVKNPLPVEVSEDERMVTPQGDFEILGRATHGNHVSRDTEFIPGPLCQLDPEAFVRVPAALRDDDPRCIVRHNILLRGVEKYGVGSQKLTAEEQMVLRKYFSSLFRVERERLRMRGVEPRVLSYAESIATSEILDNMADLALDTSCGWPYKTYGYTKRQMWEDLENGVVGPVEKAFHHRMECAARHEITDTIWLDTLKDEKRHIDKVKLGKTRVFNIAPVDLNLVIRALTASFSDMIKSMRERGFCQLGINMESIHADHLFRTLLSFGDEGFYDADYSQFDGRIHPSFWELFFDVINDYYADEYTIHRRTICHTLQERIAMAENLVYIVRWGNPSGCALTTVFNSFVNACYLRLAYMAFMERRTGAHTLAGFDQVICDRNYGDDLILATKLSEAEMNEIFQLIQDRGLVITDGEKQGLPSVKDIHQLIFLQRNFIKGFGGLYYGALSDESIKSMIGYVRRSMCNAEGLWQLYHTALRAALFRGRSYYNYLWLFIQRDQDNSVGLPDYDAMLVHVFFVDV